MRDHGGDLDRARRLYGGTDWLDLSTGINPRPYPLPAMGPEVWGALPLGAGIAALEASALEAFGATGGSCVALSGASAAIQLVPRLGRPGRARVLGPTYNEHAAALRAAGWAVEDAPDIAALEGAGLAVIVNPNNPDGARHAPDRLFALARRVGLLVVDESFADAEPGLSLLPRWHAAPERARILVLRSFGKFYGLAGVRLGFAVGPAEIIDELRRMAGPWAVSGPAIAAGRAAYADRDWRDLTVRRLADEAERLDRLAGRAGWSLVGGTTLFRTYDTPGAAAVQETLARQHIWTRRFPYSEGWLRIGLPGAEAGWQRLQDALAG